VQLEGLHSVQGENVVYGGNIEVIAINEIYEVSVSVLYI
jgi:hypothetical protein